MLQQTAQKGLSFNLCKKKLNQKNRNLVSEWNGCQSLLQILHLHLLKPMPQDEIPYFKDQYFILLKKWHTQNIQNLMIISVFSAEQTLADEDTKSADTGCPTPLSRPCPDNG